MPSISQEKVISSPRICNRRINLTSEVPPGKLRWTSDPSRIPVSSTEHMKPIEAMVGQPRAHHALMFGINVKESGFNIYAAGLPGTGKTTTVLDFLKETARDVPVPSDWCYVNNFSDEYQPKVLECPAGIGRQLKRDLREAVQAARVAIPQLFEGTDYAAKPKRSFAK